MSKNYELLQQVEFGLGATNTFVPGERPVAAERIFPATSEALASVEPLVREEALKLVQRLFLAPEKPPSKAVLFAAIDGSIGCNWLCAVTAQLLAKNVSGSVCLVEGNFRTPSFPESLGLDRERGLVDSLRQEGSIRKFTAQVGQENCWLLSSGAPVQDSMVLLNSDRMKERFSEIRREFDYVVVNAPPLGAFADAMALGRLVDGVVLVLEANTTRREAALRITEGLRATNIPVLGAVLNNRTFPIPAAVYKRL
jgi:Mrp family chromosome partitioning ATPase